MQVPGIKFVNAAKGVYRVYRRATGEYLGRVHRHGDWEAGTRYWTVTSNTWRRDRARLICTRTRYEATVALDSLTPPADLPEGYDNLEALVDDIFEGLT